MLADLLFVDGYYYHIIKSYTVGPMPEPYGYAALLLRSTQSITNQRYACICSKEDWEALGLNISGIAWKDPCMGRIHGYNFMVWGSPFYGSNPCNHQRVPRRMFTPRYSQPSSCVSRWTRFPIWPRNPFLERRSKESRFALRVPKPPGLI